MQLLLSLIAGLGIGTFLGSYINLKWDKKKFIYKVKLNLYSDFIGSYQNLVADNSNEEKRQIVVANLKNLELIASRKIIDESQKFYNGGGTETRDILIQYMRDDLINTIK